MAIRQISVFIENKPGTLCRTVELLGKAGIDLRAISVADTLDFGILRIITSETERAFSILSENGCTVHLSEVTVVKIPDTPGAMSNIVSHIAANGLNIEYLYSILSPVNKNAYIVFRIKDTEKAVKVLTEGGFELAKESDII